MHRAPRRLPCRSRSWRLGGTTRVAVHQYFFQIRARERWWYLSGAVQTRYSRPATRQLAQRFEVQERAPRPTGISTEAYERLTNNPNTHQVVWVAAWLEALGGAGARVDALVASTSTPGPER